MFLGNFIGGVSIGWWKETHNVHHIVTNHVEHDCDIQHLPFFAVSEKLLENVYSSYHQRIIDFQQSSIAKLMVPIQHLTFYIVMLFGRFNMYVQTFVYLFRALRSNQAMFKFAKYELMSVIGYYIWFSNLMSYLNTETIFWYILLANSAAFILHIQITISHFGLPCDNYPLLSINENDNPLQSFPARNLSGTMDVDCPEWMDWFHGGLQYQTTVFSC